MASILLDIVKQSSTSQVYWDFKSDLGEARNGMMIGVMPKNDFMYLFNLATMTVCNEGGSCRPVTKTDNGYTKDTSAWAKKQLVQYFDIVSEMHRREQGMLGMILGIEGGGLRLPLLK